MNDYTILVTARNRALAAEPSAEQRMVYRLFQYAIDHHDNIAWYTMTITLNYARWYINQPHTGEG